MARRERDISSTPSTRLPKHAAKTNDLVDEAIAVGHGRSDQVVTHVKMLRLELVKVVLGYSRRSFGRGSAKLQPLPSLRQVS